MRNVIISAALAVMSAQAMTAYAQSSQPTKTAPISGIDSNWSQGLSKHNMQLMNGITRRKSDFDRRMLRTAIVRNREASRDIFVGERLTDEKVLANVRVRMSIQESQRWSATRSRLNAEDRRTMLSVLRDDLATKH